MLRKIIEALKFKFANRSNSAKIDYIRKRGGTIGENTILLSSASCFGSEPYLVSIGNNCLISSDVSFVTHDGSLNVLNNLGYCEPKMDKMRPVKVGNNTFIGMRSIIMPGVTIGDNCIIGAGSIVVKDVEDNTVVAGVPARFICTIDDYYRKNIKYLYPTYTMSSIEKKEYLLKNMKF